jgi:hypothetical protein
MIGKHRPKYANKTGLREAIAIGLDEAFTALEESFYDLNDDQVSAFPVPGRNNIAWIVMHTLHNLDFYTNAVQTGRRVLPDERRWGLWIRAELPKPGNDFPSSREMMDKLEAVRSAAMKAIEGAEENDLRKKQDFENRWERTRADAYMRTIYHTMAHVRQIWFLRGVLGTTDEKPWPRQHWA